ncbi:MAG: Hpt domain-containing protein [Lysobacterales bacterium]
MRETSMSMDAIVWNYHESLPEKVAEFERLWTAWQSDPPSREACDAFRVLIHRMSGATAAFGYEELARRAVELERLLRPGVCLEDHLPGAVYRHIEQAAVQLLDALRRGAREEHPPQTPT